MDEHEPNLSDVPTVDPTADDGLPPGDHALEIAARTGFGPLSPLASEIWHGGARPCVSCGQLVRRDALECESCGEDLGEDMAEKMRVHSGPWYVLEHVRPFPGVSLERIIRQVRRGLITETSIVRGPATDHQWRFAVETPGLCRYFGRCWSCQETVSPSDSYCKHCLSHLSFEQPRPAPAAPPGPASVAAASSAVSGPSTAVAVDAGTIPTDELQELSAAVHRVDLPTQGAAWDEPPRIGGIRATWVVLAALIIVTGTLVAITQSRGGPERPAAINPPGIVQPRP